MRRWLLVSTSLAIGCSYPAFVFVPDDASAPPVEAALPDDVSIDTSAPSIDTNVVTPDVPDGFAPIDTAVVDTQPEVVVVETGAKTGCAGSTDLFCADFDTVSAPATNWTYSAVGPTGSIALESTGAYSAPNAFVAATSPSSTDKVVVANLSKVFTATASTTPMRADIWFKLETATFPGDAAFLLKVQRASGMGDGVTFSIDAMGFFVDRIGVTYAYYPVATKPKPGVWMHARLDVTLDTAAGAFTLWLDDMTTPALARTGVSTEQMDTTARQLIVGLYSQNATAAFKVRYDDVSFSFR